MADIRRSYQSRKKRSASQESDLHPWIRPLFEDFPSRENPSKNLSPVGELRFRPPGLRRARDLLGELTLRPSGLRVRIPTLPVVLNTTGYWVTGQDRV